MNLQHTNHFHQVFKCRILIFIQIRKIYIILLELLWVQCGWLGFKTDVSFSHFKIGIGISMFWHSVRNLRKKKICKNVDSAVSALFPDTTHYQLWQPTGIISPCQFRMLASSTWMTRNTAVPDFLISASS